MRKLKGPMAEWDLHALLLRRLDILLAGANWQRGGGKGKRPKPIDLPDARSRGDRPAPSKPAGEDMAQRLRNLGLIPPGPGAATERIEPDPPTDVPDVDVPDLPAPQTLIVD
jgi:hypothetical protein